MVVVIAFTMPFSYTSFTIRKGDSSMEQRKNLCAQVPISLHNRVTEAREQLGQTTAEYITNLLQQYSAVRLPYMVRVVQSQLGDKVERLSAPSAAGE